MPVQHEAACDLCMSMIVGVRYKCVTCPCFDVCWSCFPSRGKRHPLHAFVRVTDAQNLISTRPAHLLQEHGNTCDHCQTSIVGARYRCLHPSCLAFDLCEACEALPFVMHPVDHPLVKLRIPTMPYIKITPEDLAIHPWLATYKGSCDVCGGNSRFSEDHYKCSVCPNFDMCKFCFHFDSRMEQHPSHQFYRIVTPKELELVDPPGVLVHSGIRCDSCQTSPIIGARFKCVHPECPDFDLCSECEALPIRVHPITHPMLKFYNVATEIPNTHNNVGTSSPESSPKRTATLEEIIGAKIVGQKGAVASVASAIRLRQNGWVNPDRPLTMLFLGSSGVGKTEVAKQIALYLNGKDGNTPGAGQSLREIESNGGFVRIDMSEYQERWSTSSLIGSAKGLIGHEDGGILTSKLQKNPKAVVLLDEIEKAHPDVLTIFLQIFDDGRLTDPKFGTIDCKDAVFIMASNLASDEIKEKASLLRDLISEAASRPEEYAHVTEGFIRQIHPVLKASLKRDEFLGRINQIVVFLPLDENEITVVIQAALSSWGSRAKANHNITLTWSSDVVRKLVRSYDVNFGARSVINEVDRSAGRLVAEAQIRGDVPAGAKANLHLNKRGDIQLTVRR